MRVKLPAHPVKTGQARLGLPGNENIIIRSAFLPAYKAGHPADLPVKLSAIPLRRDRHGVGFSGHVDVVAGSTLTPGLEFIVALSAEHPADLPLINKNPYSFFPLGETASRQLCVYVQFRLRAVAHYGILHRIFPYTVGKTCSQPEG